jgi:hypothetical protein
MATDIGNLFRNLIDSEISVRAASAMSKKPGGQAARFFV